VNSFPNDEIGRTINAKGIEGSARSSEAEKSCEPGGAQWLNEPVKYPPQGGVASIRMSLKIDDHAEREDPAPIVKSIDSFSKCWDLIYRSTSPRPTRCPRDRKLMFVTEAGHVDSVEQCSRKI